MVHQRVVVMPFRGRLFLDSSARPAFDQNRDVLLDQEADFNVRFGSDFRGIDRHSLSSVVAGRAILRRCPHLASYSKCHSGVRQWYATFKRIGRWGTRHQQQIDGPPRMLGLDFFGHGPSFALVGRTNYFVPHVSAMASWECNNYQP
jgi:hypothetical protein